MRQGRDRGPGAQGRKIHSVQVQPGASAWVAQLAMAEHCEGTLSLATPTEVGLKP